HEWRRSGRSDVREARTCGGDAERAPGAKASLRGGRLWSGAVTSISATTRVMPTLAVVVVTRNEERRIGRCLDSVFRALEAYPNTRVVVVDSGSTDDTIHVAQRYPATVCRYCGPVRSPAAGRRIGSQQVDAQCVMFLDGDRALPPEWWRAALRL